MRRALRLPVPSWSRALTLGLLVSLVALAGCLGGDGDDVPPANAGCPVGEGVLELHILPGAWESSSTSWYEPANPSLDGIHTVCWINDDDQWHKIIAYPGTVDTTPEWVREAIATGEAPADPHAGHGDGGGHDHGGDGGHDHGSTPATFDIEINPGASLAMPLTPAMAGRLDVHCHPHPWMASTWDVLPNGTLDYPIEVGNVVYTGAYESDDVAVTESKAVNFDLNAPNLKRISAIVRWVDDDSVENISQSNAKDTLQVELRDPGGTVVVTKPASDSGEIRLDHIITTTWPETIAGQGEQAAVAALGEGRPDDASTAGTWSVVVTVVSAPGPIPDSNGQTAPVQSATDGAQNFTVSLQSTHEFGKVLAAGSSPMHGMVYSVVTITPS